MTYSMLKDLEAQLGHQFTQTDLLKTALTHRSYHFENRAKSTGHFERLEFLGDAVLDLVLSEALMSRFPDVDEGSLSKWRASLVNESTLGEIAREINLGKYLYLGKSEEAGRENARPRLLASALEALLAAVYLDAGMDSARSTIGRLFAGRLSQLDGNNQYATDFKTRLQEWSQKNLHTVPEYRLVSSQGPEHAKIFSYEVLLAGKKMGAGDGNSRKAAEQEAACGALLAIEKGGGKKLSFGSAKNLNKNTLGELT